MSRRVRKAEVRSKKQQARRRSLLAAVVALVWAPVLVSGAILPEALGDFQRTGVQAFTPVEAAVFQEFGFDAGEKAGYAAAGRKLEITALRAKDPTGAYGMYHWLRPPDGKPAGLGERAVESGDTAVLQFGNYVLILRGARPEPEHLKLLIGVLPRLERSAAPPIEQYLPADARVPLSDRFILGPVGLEKLAPAIRPSVVGFHLGVEAHSAEYSTPSGRLKLVLFSYPTPQMARAQLEDFQKAGVMAKRSGPLIGVVVDPFSRDEAEKLLARVRYQANITWSQQPSKRDNVGDLILNILLLTAILMGMMVAAGVGLGGFRILLSRMMPGTRFDTAADSEIIRLRLGDK